SANGVGAAHEPALAVIDVDDDLLSFHANQVGMAVLVQVANAVDAALLTQAALPGDVGPLERTNAAEDLSPRRALESRLPGDDLELSVAVKIDGDGTGTLEPGFNDRAGGGTEGPVAAAQVDGNVRAIVVAGQEIDDAVAVNVGQGAGADVGKI